MKMKIEQHKKKIITLNILLQNKNIQKKMFCGFIIFWLCLHYFFFNLILTV